MKRENFFKVNRTKIGQLLNDLDGKIASVAFVKKDKTLRQMNFRLGVSKGVKGEDRTPVARYDTPYVTAFDLKQREFRNINLSTVLWVRTAGSIYYVV